MSSQQAQAPTYTLAEIAQRLGAELHGEGSARVARIVEPAAASAEGDLAVVIQPERLPELVGSGARLALLRAGMTPPAQLVGYLCATEPRYALAQLLQLYEPAPRLAPGVHPSAVVEASARIAESAHIGALSYVGADAVIGEQVRILPQVSIGAGSTVGDLSLLHSGVRIAEGTVIGRRVIIQSNACIGGAGFSYATPERGSVESARAEKEVTAINRGILRIPSLGRVVVEDDVEIGAGATIDRATLGETRIGRGCKIDNLVMIGHNCALGADCLIAAQTGIAGSCRIGARVVMGGQVGIADHVSVGDDAVLAASAGVAYDVPARVVMIDSPAVPYREFTLRYRAVARVQRMLRDLQELRQRVLRLERER